jgi:UDP-N-acetylmuramoyl-tripeptide--D-alanyl-D-alanine ligase
LNTHLVGEYNLPNILCAVAAGKFFNVPDEKIKSALESYVPSNSRSQMIEQQSNHIILDAYNANPSSMRAAIENFAKVKADSKVLMLGAMMELGEESIAEHQGIVDLIKQYQWKDVVLVGGDYAKTDHHFTWLSSSAEARDWYRDQQFSNTYILIKGSRSMKMETVLEEHTAA